MVVMSNSLDNFIREAWQEHDGIDPSEMPTVAVTKRFIREVGAEWLR